MLALCCIGSAYTADTWEICKVSQNVKYVWLQKQQSVRHVLFSIGSAVDMGQCSGGASIYTSTACAHVILAEKSRMTSFVERLSLLLTGNNCVGVSGTSLSTLALAAETLRVGELQSSME